MPEYIITNSKGKEKRYSFPTADAAASYLDYARQNNLKVDQVYFDTDNSEQRFPVTKIELDDKGVVHTEVDGDIDRYLTDRNTFNDIGYGLGQKPMSEAYREAYSKGVEPTFEITKGNGARIIEEHDPTRVVPREEYDPARLQRTVQSVQGLGDRMGGVLSDRGISPIDATQPMSKIAGRTSSPIVDKATEYASSEIGGERLSAEDAARMEESPEYRDVYWNIRRKYGVTPDEYVAQQTKKLNTQFDAVLAEMEKYRTKIANDDSKWQGVTDSRYNPQTGTYDTPINPELQQIDAIINYTKLAKRDLNDSRTKYGEKDGWHFGKRLWEGGNIIARIMPIVSQLQDIQDVLIKYGQAGAANQMVTDPENMSDKQLLLHSLTALEQSVDQLQEDMGGKHWASGAGEVLQEMPAFMMGMPFAKLFSKAVTKGATKGLARLAGKAVTEVAAEAAETAAETVARRALDKATGWGKKWAKSFGRSAIEAPTQTLFYKSLAEENLGQYQVRPDGSTIQIVTPAWQRVYRAWLGTALELHSEDMGMWIGKGLNALGRRMANVGFVRGLMRVPAARSPLMEVIRKELKVADPLSEALGEVYGDAIQPLFTGDFDWSQTLADPDYWLTTVVSSAGVSVAMELPSIMQFKRDADRVNKYGMQMDYSLAVMGEDLRGQLVAAVSHNSIADQTKALANIDWKNVSRQDMAAAMDYVNAYVGRELYYNSYREAERQTALQRQMNNLLALSYRGESGYGNTMSTIKATAKPSSGLPLNAEYYIISGDITQQGNQMLNVIRVDQGTPTREVVFADQINIGASTDIADELAKQYDLMFGEELAREGVVSISQRIARMRAEGVNEETIREVVSEDPAYHEYKEGDVVTDNQTGEPVTINEQTSTGEYIAAKSSGERIAISYDQIADSGAYAERAIERERTSGGVKEGDVVSFLDRDGEMVEGAVQQILSDGRIYVSVQTGENNGVPTYATQEIISNQIIPAEAQPAQLTPTEQVAEEVAADAAAEVQATEQTAPAEVSIEPQPAEVASTADPRAIPTLEDGSIDYDAIEDPQQLLDLYSQDLTPEEIVEDITSMRDQSAANADRLSAEVATAQTLDEKKALRAQAKAEAAKVYKYQAVLDLLTPVTPITEQAEAVPTAPGVAPVAAEVVEPITEEQATEQPEISNKQTENNANFIGRSLTSDETKTVISAMQQNAEQVELMELTPENWIAQFGEDGILATPIGDVKMGENQYFKLAKKGRDGKLGMIKPTLLTPDVIIEEKSIAKDGQVTERDSSYVFVKAFTNDDGSRNYLFTSVTIRKGGKEVVISNQEKETPRIERLLKEGKLAYISKATLPSEPTNSTQGNQSTILGGAILSESKDTTTEPITQEIEQENLQPTPENVAEEQMESSQLENEVVEPTSRGTVDMDTLQLTMSDEEFNSMLESSDMERMNGYLKELDDTLVINDQSPFKGQQELREEFKRLKEQYGGEDNIPTDVMEDINARYKPYAELSRKVYDRKYALEDRLRLAEVQSTQTAKKEEAEAKETHQATAFNGFLANKTKLGASSAEKALNKKVKIEDKNYTIAEYVEQAVQSGKIELRTSEVPKYKGVSRRKWNQMDTAQQQAEQERIKNGGTVTEYYINDYNLGKVAYDYAQYLQAKAKEQAPETALESQPQSAVEPEWLQKVPTDGRNFMVYTKVAGENSYSATDLKTGQAVGLVYASLVKRDRLQSLVEELPKVLLEGAHFQIRDTNGKIYYSSEPIAPTKGKKKAATKLTALKTVSGAEVKVPINLYKYVSTDKTRAYTGVYFDPEGFVVATDGHNMIAVKHDVAEADAEKFISKAGDVASTVFNWRIANPKPNTEKPMNVDFEDMEKQIGGKAGDKFVVFEIDGQEVGFPPKAIHVLADFQRAFGGQAFVGDMTAGKAIVIRSGDNYAIALQTTKYADLSQAIHIPSGIEQTTEQVEQPAAVSEQAQQPTEPTKQEPKPKRTADRKIEDYGEKIAGARKDILRNMSKNFDNATIESLVALPFAKAFVKPDLKKLVEAGVLRPDDAKYAEAIMWVYINKNKPKARKTDVWAAKRGRETRITAWAKKTFDGITRLRDFIEADEATRDELIAQYGQLGEQIKANEDIDRVRLNRLNGGALVFGDLYSPNPIEVVVAALDKLNYQAGDKIIFDAPIVKAEYLGRYFNFENQDGEKVYAFSRANSIEEAIDTLVLQAKIRRGDTDIQYPTYMFSITREDPIREPSGMFTVFHINKRGSLIPETVEGREAAEKKVADYQSQGLSADLREEKKIVGYATHRIRFKNRLTDVETIFDEKFGSEGEARQALEERYDEFNDLANDYVASLSKQKREQPVPFEVTTSWNSETKVVKYVVKNTETGDVMSPQLDTRKEAEEYYKNHIEEWKAKWQEMKDARKKFVFFDDNVKPREGQDYRNGRDVTAEDLATTFGFRGIQFGNWTNDADRQAALNQAYDAFMDLADILGVSPKALSLAGELGIAFGARGGGSALAHYEPDEIVINLTKTKGAGSLAHEWWHALDNYFSRQGNIPMGFVTSNPTEAKMREEMRAAWQGVVKAVKGTEYAKRSMAQGDYWGRMLEMTARLFGEWTVYELAKTGRTNHFLSRGITPGRFDMWRRINYAAYKWSLPEDQTPMSFEEFALLPRSLKGMPFPTKEETEQMGEAVRNLFDVVQEKVDEQGNVVLFQRGDFPEMPNTEANRRAYKLIREKLRKKGIEVHEVSEEMARQMAEAVGAEYQIVYHGSGAKFDRFDHSFMGTGEGAQAYGYGTYVTQMEGIGKTYAEQVSYKRGDNIEFLKYQLDALDGNIAREKEDLEWHIKQTTAIDKWLSEAQEEYDNFTKEADRLKTEFGEESPEYRNYIFYDYQVDELAKAKRSKADNTETIAFKRDRIATLEYDRNKLAQDIANWTPPVAYLYSVDIPDSNGEYLQWEREYNVVELDKIVERLNDYGIGDFINEDSDSIAGSKIYETVSLLENSDKSASELLSKAGFVGIEYPAQYRSGGRADNAKNYVIFNENDLKIIDRVELFQDAEGKIYGWAVGGEIYLTPDGLNANTAIHEYSHLWVETLRKKDSKKWAEIKSQLKVTPFWQQVIDDPNYERIRENEDAVASEVLARLTGKNGAERLASEAQRIIDAGNGSLSARIEATALVQRVKRLLRDLWAWVARNIFGVTNEATISQLSDMVVDDLLDETPLTDAENSPFEAMFIGELGANVLDIEQKVSYRMANMDVAIQMEQAGKSPFDIKIATGWERGADGEWRYEISDAEAHLNIEAMAELNQRLDSGVRQRNADKLRQFEQNNPSLAKKRQEMIEKYSINSSAVEALDEVFELTPVVAEFKLRDLFDYNEAYEAYPQLMNTRVRVIDGMRSLGAHWGDNIDISLEVAQIPARMRATLLHEIQHSIQSIEGFAAGGNKEVAQELMREMEQEVLIFDFAGLVRGELRENPDLTDRQVTQKVISELKERTGFTREELESAKRIPSSKQRVEALAAARNPELYEYYWGVFQIFNAALDDEGNVDSMKAYRNLMGEVEARNTTSRRNMTAEQRRSSLGSATEDVNRGVQIYRSRQGDDFESLSEESKYSSRVEALSAVAHDVAAKLNAPIRVITDMDDMPRARQSWKGWWQRGESGEQIVVVVPNNIDAADIERTILHEAVAHYGLRKLLGESQFNLLLDTVLKSMTEEEVQQRMRKYGTNDPMVVADEYIAEVAEGNVTPSMFERVVSAVRAFLRDVLGLSVQMTDNDIRYLLWQSKNALEGKSAFGRAMVMAQGKPLADMVAEEYGYARAYTAEEQQIIDDAQRNGTYLKAPNGKPTNLTPKQWVQARTMAFKRWFGDWILPTMETPIHKSKGTFANLAEAEKWAKENLQGKKEKNRYTGEEISIGKNSIKEMLDPKFSKAINEQVHISALQSVLDFIKTGVPAEIHPDTHGRDFNVMRLYNAIEIEGKVYRVKSTVRKVKEGDKYYTYEIQEMELLEDTHNALGLPNANDRGRLNSNNSITAAKLLKGVKKTNSNEDILSHSQILDANGEPMVVWHGGTFAINEFTPKWAMHFGTKEAALQRILDQNWGYGNWEIIRNDDDTFGWKYTDPDAGEYEDEDYSRQSDKSFATPIEALEDATESMFDYVAHPYYLNIRNVERVDDMQDDDGWDNAIDEAKRSGVDGLVYRNDFEDEGNDSYIAFRSEQIKSAEINSGEFDPTDPDIRARRKDFLDAEGNTTKATPMKQAREVKPEREFRANNLFGRFFETFWRYTGASQVVAGKAIDGLVIKAGEKELARRIKKGEELLRKREAPFVSAFIKKKIGKGDAMAAFQKLSKADKLQLSKVITGFNPVVDYMSAENRSESQGEYALKKYFDGFIAPLNESRRRMREVMGISDQELETYVSGESSLERHNSGTDALSTDETKAWSLKKVEGIVTRFRSRLRNNMELQLKQQGANALSEAEKELLGEDLIKKLTEEGYDSLSAGEQMAACEAPVEVLWERIRALNNEHLNILLRAGRYSHDDIERIKSHDWRYYVPMFKQDLNVEGLIDPAAVYDVDVFYGTPSAPSLKPALGRDTKSQDVFRSMYQLGQRCVVFEVRNRVARSLYDFTIWANDHLGLFETRKYWHEGITYQTKTASGKWVDEDTMPSREEQEQMLATQREIAALNRERLDISRQIKRLSSQIEEVHSEQAADLIDDALRGLVNRKEEILDKIVKLEADRKWRAKKSNFDFEDPTSAQAIEPNRTVRVWIDGREHRMVFADPDIARAVNGNKNGIVKAIEWFGRLVGPFTRFRAQMNTQYSPDFIVSNTLRDYQHALLAMAMAEQGDITLSFAKNHLRHLGDVWRSRGINYNPLSEAELEGRIPYYSYERMRSAYIAAKVRGEQITEEEFDRAYRDWVSLNRQYLEDTYGKARVRDTFIDAFQRYGGATGFIHQLNSKQIEKQLREAMLLKEDVLARRYMDPTTPFRLIRDVISRVSESMEDITRFATFMAHLDHGASVERAAQEAKDVTTNFNRRGELATGLGSLYMFFNASVQGSAQVMRLIKQHPRRAAVVLPLYALLGFMQRITRGMLWKIGTATGIKAFFFDDDDEERPRTEEQLEKEKAIRDYMYSDNLIIVLDRTLDAADTALDGIYLRIPQPNGFRAAYKVGVELAEVAMGEQRWDELPESLISTLAGEFVYGFGDTGELTSDMWRMVIPSAVQPISDLLLNKDFVNRTIYNEREYNPIAPAYTVAKSNTPSLYIDASRILNSIGGTDTRSADYNKRYEKRAIGLDVPPEAIKYLVGEMFGGVGTFANRMWTTVELMTDGEKGNLAKRDIPFVNRVIGEFEPENVWPKYKSLTDQIEAAWSESSGFRAEQGIDVRKSEWNDPDVTYPYLIEHYKDNPYAVEMLRKRWLLGPYFKEIEDYTESLKRLGEGASSSDRASESRNMSSEAEIHEASRTLTEKFVLELSKHVDWQAATNEEVIEQVEQITGEIKGKNQ